jgi:asparagine synthetase B (glutamine-hydrolysing)
MADWLDELELRLRRATRRWLPKHPSGLALSGGLDSSALWAEVVALREEGLTSAKSVRPVSLFFPGYPCDERLYVERTLHDTGDRVLAIDGTRETALSLRPILLQRLDTVPFSTSYTVQLMAEAAAIDGRLTLMTGHLGDHLFDLREPDIRARTGRFLRAALNTIPGPRWAPRVYSALRRQTLSKAHKSDLDLLQKEWRTEISRRRWNRGLRRYSPMNVISNRLRSERTGWSLQSWEQICAGFGVEVRHPFSDPDLIAFAASVPRSLCASGLTKPVLRAVYRQRLPGMIVDRRDKISFDCLAQRDSPTLATTVPPADWFLVSSGIVDPVALDSLLDAANNNEEARKTVLRVEAVEFHAQSLMAEL